MSQIKNADEWEEREVVRRLYVPDLAKYAPGQNISLAAEEQHYALNVLRIATGQQVQLFDGCGSLSSGQVCCCRKKELLVAVGDIEKAPPITGPVLAVGYCKRFDQVLEKATELGAAAVIPLRLERTAVAWSENKRDHFEKIILAAARQSFRAYLPTLEPLMTMADIFAKFQNIAAALPHGQSMNKLPCLPDCLLIGPEGGFSPAELAIIKEKEVMAYGLGPHILRVETAALASLAAYWQC